MQYAVFFVCDSFFLQFGQTEIFDAIFFSNWRNLTALDLFVRIIAWVIYWIATWGIWNPWLALFLYYAVNIYLLWSCCLIFVNSSVSIYNKYLQLKIVFSRWRSVIVSKWGIPVIKLNLVCPSSDLGNHRCFCIPLQVLRISNQYCCSRIIFVHIF